MVPSIDSRSLSLEPMNITLNDKIFAGMITLRIKTKIVLITLVGTK